MISRLAKMQGVFFIPKNVNKLHKLKQKGNRFIFLTFKSFLIFFTVTFILIMLGIAFEEILIRFEQRVLRVLKALPAIIRAALR